MNVIVNLIEVKEGAEKIKGYWDETGLDMHIVVTSDKKVVVSSKHWIRVHYIQTELDSNVLWGKLEKVSDRIGRKLIRSEKGSYVYINKLNIEQTQEVFDIIVKVLGVDKGDISRVWELSWDIENAVLP